MFRWYHLSLPATTPGRAVECARSQTSKLCPQVVNKVQHLGDLLAHVAARLRCKRHKLCCVEQECNMIWRILSELCPRELLRSCSGEDAGSARRCGATRGGWPRVMGLGISDGMRGGCVGSAGAESVRSLAWESLIPSVCRSWSSDVFFVTRSPFCDLRCCVPCGHCNGRALKLAMPASGQLNVWLPIWHQLIRPLYEAWTTGMAS